MTTQPTPQPAGDAADRTEWIERVAKEIHSGSERRDANQWAHESERVRARFIRYAETADCSVRCQVTREEPARAIQPTSGESEWFCPSCQRVCDPVEVTFQETHTDCGTTVSARAIQAGKGAVIDDAMVWRACKAYRPGMDASALGVPADMAESMHRALEAALAGSQGEGALGRCGTCGEQIRPHYLTGTTCACARGVRDATDMLDQRLHPAYEPPATTPDPAAEDAARKLYEPDEYADAFKGRPAPAAPDGDELVAAATRTRVVLQQIVASPRHKGPLVSGASAASWALGQALSKPRVGEAVAGCWRAKWRGATDFGGWVDGLLSDEDVAKLKAHGLAEVQRAYTHSPAAIPDGMVVGDTERLNFMESAKHSAWGLEGGGFDVVRYDENNCERHVASGRTLRDAIDAAIAAAPNSAEAGK